MKIQVAMLIQLGHRDFAHTPKVTPRIGCENLETFVGKQRNSVYHSAIVFTMDSTVLYSVYHGFYMDLPMINQAIVSRSRSFYTTQSFVTSVTKSLLR